jgi:hypothetical protein
MVERFASQDVAIQDKEMISILADMARSGVGLIRKTPYTVSNMEYMKAIIVKDYENRAAEDCAKIEKLLEESNSNEAFAAYAAGRIE